MGDEAKGSAGRRFGLLRERLKDEIAEDPVA
jgi:hypothetical protein